MKSITYLVLLACLTFSANAQQTSDLNDIEAVTKPLMSYLTGHIKGDKVLLGQALHSEGKLSYLGSGEYRKIEFSDYLSRMKLRDPNDGVSRIPYIKHIDVTGNMAVGKLVLDYSSRLFTDYMTLLKIAGEWKIVNKTAYSIGDPNNNKAASVNIPELLAPIKRLIQAYQSGDIAPLSKVYQKDAKIMSIQKGRFQAVDLNTFIGNFKQQFAKHELIKEHQIQNLDATGNAALVKVLFQYSESSSAHYLSLLKVDGMWKIVNHGFDVTATKTK